MAGLHREVAGTLRVAAFSSLAAALVPKAIQKTRQRYPLLEIVVEEMEPDEGLTALGSWSTDLAVVDDFANSVVARQKDTQHIFLLEDTGLYR